MNFKKVWCYGGDAREGADDFIIRYVSDTGVKILVNFCGSKVLNYSVGRMVFDTLKVAKAYVEMRSFSVYDFARAWMDDPEAQMGGIITNEHTYLDLVGFPHLEKDGCVVTGQDLDDFYSAMATLKRLNDKYRRGFEND